MPLSVRWKVSLVAVLAALGLAFVGGATTLWLVSQPSGPPSVTMPSDSLATFAERAAFLDRYLPGKPVAAPADGTPPDSALVFDVWMRNNSGGLVPGPSDWSIRVLARVDSADLDAWRGDLAPADSVDTTWLEGVPAGPLRDGLTEWYGDAFRSVGIDRARGVVAFRSATD